MENVGKFLRSQIDPARLWSHVEKLATMERVGGTPGEKQAIDYVVAALAEYGVPARLDEYTAYISMPEESELEILEPERLAIRCRPRGFSASTPEEGVEAEVVFVPSAADRAGTSGMIFASFGGAEEFSGDGLAGKIILSSRGGADGVKAAQDAGAIAHCHMWPSGEDVIHELDVLPIWGTPTPETAGLMLRIPAVGIRKADGEKVKELCRRGAVRARLRSKVTTGWKSLTQPIATVEGTAEPESFLLVSAHLCSWYVGTTDNATGAATLLELARVLSEQRGKLRRSVRFAWWTGHEQGHYAGSTWYVDSNFADLRGNCVAYLNIDSPGVRGADLWDFRYNHAEVEQFIRSVMLETTGREWNLRRPYKAGDQSFWGVGVPSLGAFRMLPLDSPDRGLVGGCGGGWWWQTPADTIDKAEPGQLASDVEMYATIAGRVCAAEKLPFEFVTVAKDFETLLGELKQDADGRLDLSSVRESVAAFRAAAQRVESLREKVSDSDVSAFNAGLMGISRIVNPVLYTRASDFDQDTGVQLPQLPGLQLVKRLAQLVPGSDEYQFLMTRLLRERNRADDALYRAAGEMNRMVKGSN